MVTEMQKVFELTSSELSIQSLVVQDEAGGGLVEDAVSGAQVAKVPTV